MSDDGLDSEQARGPRDAAARFFERAPDLAVVLAPDGGILDVNPAFVRVLGYAAEEVVGRDCGDLVHEHDREAAGVALTALERGEPVSDFELRARAKDGSWRTLLCSAVRTDGAIFGIGRDITARRRREEAGRLAREALEGAFDSAPIGMAVTDLEGRFVQANPALAEMLGMTIDEVIGDGLDLRMPPGDATQVSEGLRRLLAGEARTYRGEHELLRADGGVVTALVTVTVMADAEGNPFQAFCQIVDVTESRLAEDELRRREHQLTEAQRVAQLGAGSGTSRRTAWRGRTSSTGSSASSAPASAARSRRSSPASTRTTGRRSS
jgi:PAS domain S-box-containing protein